MTNRIKTIMLLMVSGVTLMVCLNSCKQDHLTLATTSTVNIYDYMKQNPDQFSLFTSIVDKAGFASFLNTYGTYTFFAPTNDGVNAYLKANNLGSIDAIDATTAKGLVAIALISDTLSSVNFSDGKLRTPSTAGQYLLTGSVTKNGIATVVINKQANLLTPNIRVGNGYIHIIDYPLSPAPSTLAKTIEGDSRYKIFTAILKATKFYDTLNIASAANTVASRKNLTVIAIPDSAFINAPVGQRYADFNAVKARYSTTGDPTNHTDSLWLYAAYHIWPELSYLSDLAVVTAHSTLAPLEVSTSSLIGTAIYINHDLFNNVQEPGQLLYRPQSDVSANNGVIHTAVTNYTIVKRFPAPVYYDLGAQPEIIKTPGLYRVGGTKTGQFNPGTLANVVGTGSSNYYLTYYNDVTRYYYGNDYIEPGVRFRTGSNGANSMEFTTPLIVKGQYKIWVDSYAGSGTQTIPTYFDGAPLPAIFNPADVLNSAETDAQAEARGFKSYSDAPVNGTGASASIYFGHVGRLLGVVNIATTGYHKIKFVATAGTGDARRLFLDVVEFRPVTMDQIHPRLGHNGNLVP